MYKYIDLEENIIDTKIIDEFNTIFPVNSTTFRNYNIMNSESPLRFRKSS